MPRFPRERSLWLIGLLLCALPLLSSCAPDANAQILSPELGDRLAAAEAGDSTAFVPTPIPPLAALTPEEQFAGLTEVAPAVAQILTSGGANPDNGPALAAANACSGCHLLDPDAVASGPSWYNLGNEAVGYVEGESPGLYVYNSIAAPNAYIVSGYAAGVMPQNFSEILSDQDFADLISYILDQQQETPEGFDPNAPAGGAVTDTATDTSTSTLTDTIAPTTTETVSASGG